MNAAAVSAVITAVTALISAGAVAVVSILRELQRTRAAATDAADRAALAATRVDEIHTIVNQQRTDMQRYQLVLTAALQAAGVPVPVDESLHHPKPDS